MSTEVALALVFAFGPAPVMPKAPALDPTALTFPANTPGPLPPPPTGYEWKRYQNEPWKLFKMAPEVVAPKGTTFPGIDRSHTCAKCGREQRVISGFNADGTHTHVCAACGNSWRH